MGRREVGQEGRGGREAQERGRDRYGAVPEAEGSKHAREEKGRERGGRLMNYAAVPDKNGRLRGRRIEETDQYQTEK